MKEPKWPLAVAVVTVFVVIVVLFSIHPSPAKDYGQWDNTDPTIRQWYQSLMQPDNPAVSCCGEADAYWADEVHYRDGRTYAVITDDRDDAPLMRQHIDVGTEIYVPDSKLKYDQGNPTHHGVIFVSRGGLTYCFVMPGGV